MTALHAYAARWADEYAAALAIELDAASAHPYAAAYVTACDECPPPLDFDPLDRQDARRIARADVHRRLGSRHDGARPLWALPSRTARARAYPLCLMRSTGRRRAARPPRPCPRRRSVHDVLSTTARRRNGAVRQLPRIWPRTRPIQPPRQDDLGDTNPWQAPTSLRPTAAA
ncbi:hypothetical protein Afe04nite_75250 [Asanoa ferruginea]|nr:hypothetical protein Afe04nite_75250 [Asanoa ferruginea]